MEKDLFVFYSSCLFFKIYFMFILTSKICLNVFDKILEYSFYELQSVKLLFCVTTTNELFWLNKLKYCRGITGF